VTPIAVLLLVGGTALELLALEGARRDLRDTHDAGEQRQRDKKKLMAASKHTVDEWITQATRTRAWGVWLFMAGLGLQLAENLAALA
jgi:hypothetical protein